MNTNDSPFQAKFKARLFFTPVYGFNLNLGEEMIADLIQESLNLYQAQGISAEYKSTRQAFQSKEDILNNPKFKLLFEKILLIFRQSVCHDYDISTENRAKFYLKRAWLNVNPKGGYNVVHNHPNAFYSGVYYLKTAKNAGEIVFVNPVAAQGLITPHEMISQYNLYTSDQHSYLPETDQILFFPSYLGHYVNPNHSEAERICIAFNISY
jgi:uncharacterized protein (TIGR02466 family)